MSRRVDDRVKKLEAKASKPQCLTDDEADAIVEAAQGEYLRTGTVRAGKCDPRKHWDCEQARGAIAEAIGCPVSAVLMDDE